MLMLLTGLLKLSINGLLKHTAKQTIASLTCLCPEGSKQAGDVTKDSRTGAAVRFRGLMVTDITVAALSLK